MLTFVAGWRSRDRDAALLSERDQARDALIFIDNQSTMPDLLPNAPIIDLYRHGMVDIGLDKDAPFSDPPHETLIRVNHDTDNQLVTRAITHSLLQGNDAQVIVSYDVSDALFRLFPALRAGNSLLAADERLYAPAGDRVVFTRGGSFAWRDHLVESQTALLTGAEVFDAGIVGEDADLGVNEYAS